MNNHGRNRKHNRRHHYVTKFPYIVHFWIQWLKNAVSEKETVQKNKGDQRNKTDPETTPPKSSCTSTGSTRTCFSTRNQGQQMKLPARQRNFSFSTKNILK